eukprot:SAG22_NODE_3321_length_1780_cov_2.068412_2_plen_101_part_00
MDYGSCSGPGEAAGATFFSELGIGGATAEVPAGGARRAEIELSAGEALYLPAGWWHQVGSQAASECLGVGEAAQACGEGGACAPAGVHMAVNFWFNCRGQ